MILGITPVLKDYDPKSDLCPCEMEVEYSKPTSKQLPHTAVNMGKKYLRHSEVVKTALEMGQ